MRRLELAATCAIAALLMCASVESAPAWGTGGGGGAPKQVDDKTRKALDDSVKRLDKAIRDRQAKLHREKENRQRDDPKQQAKEDAQYRPGFAFGPGGDMNLSK